MRVQRTPDRDELGAFLKSVRARVSPETVGIRPGRRRRTPGLRREEVAAAAGISATWYTWIEQGRDVSCSRETLSRIAQSLRMSDTERAHLFALARVDGTDHASRPVTSLIAPGIAEVADALVPNPAYVINGRWDVLHFNSACAAVLGAFDRASAQKGNVLTRIFLDPEWRRFQQWEAVAASAVAQFRAATARYAGDERVESLIAALAHASAEFSAMWSQLRVAPSPLKEKTFLHPTAGELSFTYLSLSLDAAPDDVLLVVYLGQGASKARVARLVAAT